MYRNNMNNVPGNVVEAIHRELSKIDRDAVHFAHKSVYPDDSYLFVCVGRLQKYDEGETGIYSVHTYNSSSEALNCGSYGLSYKEALEEMARRIHIV